MTPSDQEPHGQAPAASLARMPTGAKVFLILSGALLPLALIALFTTLQTTRLADVEARDRLVVTADSARTSLEGALASHVRELRGGVAALEADPSDIARCARIDGLLGDVRYAIVDRSGHLLCGERLTVAGADVLRPGELSARIVGHDGLALRVAGGSGVVATAFYAAPTLAALARPQGFVPRYGAALATSSERLQLRGYEPEGALEPPVSTVQPLGIPGLSFEMTMPGAPITAPLMIAMLLPLLMWLAAAVIAWAVVDRLLIRPLRNLRARVATYRPGEELEFVRPGPIPAEEIRALGEAFDQMARTAKQHEAELAEGLGRQTRLTREVHHRVKNNLQVIASLINFHARAAAGAEAATAYASIQRRVDALAVVHRHHYAELEEHRGLELRAVIGELAANIRATAPEASSGIGITLEVAPLLVNQDVAVAVAFLITEIVELAMSCNPAAQIRISAKAAAEEPDRAVLRVVSPAMVDSPAMEGLVERRYGRVMGGLARQLRTRLHYDPLVGAYEAAIAITGSH